MSKLKIYIASPLGFSEIGRKYYYEKIIPLLINIDLVVLDPWSLTPPENLKRIENMEYGKDRRDAWKMLNIKIAERNKEAIDSSDIVLAILDGIDVDSGTASEIGYAFARGKLIVGYRGDFRLTGDNEGSTVNLQVEYFINQSGGVIISRFDDVEQVLSKIISNKNWFLYQ